MCYPHVIDDERPNALGARRCWVIAVPPVAHKTAPATPLQVSRTGICRQHGTSTRGGAMPLVYWMLLGLVLLAGEMLLPGGLFALFGLAALVIGVLVGVGVKAPNWLQWLLFSILSIISLLFVVRCLPASNWPADYSTD